MAVKFNRDGGKIRLWKSAKKVIPAGIGINFGKVSNNKEIDEIYKVVESILTLKYGKGIKSK